MKLWRMVIIWAVVILGVWLLLEIGLRIFVESPLRTDFYSSITKEEVTKQQQQIGLKVVEGKGWVHFGWIADPDNEIYSIEKLSGNGWQLVGQTHIGSYLVHNAGGKYRVKVAHADGSESKIIGEIDVAADKVVDLPFYRPVISGRWQMLFKPQVYGYYLNDHTVYRDAEGNWRIVGITHKSDGNYNEEKYFAVGVSQDLPPANGMKEEKPVADFGELYPGPRML